MYEPKMGHVDSLVQKSTHTGLQHYKMELFRRWFGVKVDVALGIQNGGMMDDDDDKSEKINRR